MDVCGFFVFVCLRRQMNPFFRSVTGRGNHTRSVVLVEGNIIKHKFMRVLEHA